MFFFQFTGINIILQFTVEIFQTAQSSVDEFQVTFQQQQGIVTLVQYFSTFLSSQHADLVKHKIGGTP